MPDGIALRLPTAPLQGAMPGYAPGVQRGTLMGSRTASRMPAARRARRHVAFATAWTVGMLPILLAAALIFSANGAPIKLTIGATCSFNDVDNVLATTRTRGIDEKNCNLAKVQHHNILAQPNFSQQRAAVPTRSTGGIWAFGMLIAGR